MICGGPSDGSVCLGVAILICLRPLLVIRIIFVTITVHGLMLELEMFRLYNLYQYTLILFCRLEC